MSTAEPSLTVSAPPLSLADKTVFVGACALAAAGFLTVGWIAAAPRDPLGAVSLLDLPAPALVWLELTALAGVVAALGTVLAGRRVTDIGVFCAAFGLAALAFRGANATYLLNQADSAGLSTRVLGLRLMVEAAVWLVPIALAVVVSPLAARWCCPGRPAQVPGSPLLAHAGVDLPLLGRAVPGFADVVRTPSRESLLHAGFVALAGTALLGVLGASLAGNAIRHSQAGFMVALSAGLATYVAQRVVPVRSTLWGLLGLAGLAMLGYGWAAMRSAPATWPAAVPVASALRVLPLEFVGAGTIGVIVAGWLSGSPPEPIADAPTRAVPPANARARRRR